MSVKRVWVRQLPSESEEDAVEVQLEAQANINALKNAICEVLSFSRGAIRFIYSDDGRAVRLKPDLLISDLPTVGSIDRPFYFSKSGKLCSLNDASI